MRVLLINSFYYERGGDCVHTLMLKRALEEQGHDVAVLAMQHPKNADSPWRAYWPTRVEYRERASRLHDLRLFARSIWSTASYKAARALIRDFQPDVAHAHSIHHHLTLSVMQACTDGGVPSVWTLHDYRTVCPATHLRRDCGPCELCSHGRYWHGVVGRCKSESLARSAAAAIESYTTLLCGTLRGIACFVAPSQFLASKVLAMGLPAQRVEVVPNPVSVHPTASSLAQHEDGEVLFVGRLSEEKGLDVLMRAARPLGRRLGIIGDGPEVESANRLAAELELDARFYGWLNHDDVLQRMRQAALLCVPSVCYENSPTVVLEAMAVGLPVVASDIGGLTELLDSGNAGRLAPAGDPKSLQRVLGIALAQREDTRKLATVALKRVGTRHEPAQYIRAIERIYASVSARPSVDVH